MLNNVYILRARRIILVQEVNTKYCPLFQGKTSEPYIKSVLFNECYLWISTKYLNRWKHPQDNYTLHEKLVKGRRKQDKMQNLTFITPKIYHVGKTRNPLKTLVCIFPPFHRMMLTVSPAFSSRITVLLVVSLVSVPVNSQVLTW